MLEWAYSAIICPLYALPRNHIARLGGTFLAATQFARMLKCTCTTVLKPWSLPQESGKGASAQSHRPYGAKAFISSRTFRVQRGTNRRPRSAQAAPPRAHYMLLEMAYSGPLYALSRAYSQTWG